MKEFITTYFEFLSKTIPFKSDFGDYLLFFPEYAIPLRFPNKQGIDKELTMPYGTYTLSRNDFLASGLDQIRIWSRSTGIGELFGLLDHVDKAIPHGGIILNLPDNKGAIALYRGTPFIQRQPMPEGESDIQVGYINIEIRNYIL